MIPVLHSTPQQLLVLYLTHVCAIRRSSVGSIDTIQNVLVLSHRLVHSQHCKSFFGVFARFLSAAAAQNADVSCSSLAYLLLIPTTTSSPPTSSRYRSRAELASFCLFSHTQCHLEAVTPGSALRKPTMYPLEIVLSSLSLIACYLFSHRSSRRITSKHDRSIRSTNDDGGQSKPAMPSTTPPPPSSAGFVLPSYIHHARMLPVQSAHAFRYPTYYLAVCLQDLEAGRSDTGWGGRLFRWNGKDRSHRRAALTALESEDYLGAKPESSWLRKLERELQSREILAADDRLSSSRYQVWAVTMPSFFGYHGINPLTVYYIYRGEEPRRGDLAHRTLWLCLLEVHNTFTERHLYVLPTGVGEDIDGRVSMSGEEKDDGAPWGDGLAWRVNKRRSDYEHQWTFPRSFHVSPFNDRGGYYRLALKDLWRDGSTLPTLDVRLVLMVPDENDQEVAGADNLQSRQPPLRKKLLATLSSHDHFSPNAPRPLTAHNLVVTLARQPLDLFLTFVRIAWQAAILHYGKPKLDVFNKPELTVAAALSRRGEINGANSAGALPPHRIHPFDGVGWPPSLNATQIEKEQMRSGAQDAASRATAIQAPKNGSLYWTQPTSADLAAKERFCEVVKQSDVSVRIVNADGQVEEIQSQGDRETATLYLMSAGFYSDILLYRSPELALLMGSRAGRRWGVSDVDAFQRIFSTTRVSSPGGWKVGVMKQIRRRHEAWAVSLASSSGTKAESKAAHELKNQTAVNRLDFVRPTWSLVLALFSIHMGLVLQEVAFRWLGARYVPGTEPWMEWKEGARIAASDESAGQAGKAR